MSSLGRVATFAVGIGTAGALFGAGRAPFTLAVLRQDGILIPFASFDGRWRNTWPTPGRQIEVPITVQAVPRRWWPDERLRADWTAWFPDGTSRPLRVLAPAWFVAQCQANVGLKTDYQPDGPVAAPEAIPFPKDGLAVTGPIEIRPAVEPIAVLRESDREWTAVSKELGDHFDRAEAAAIPQFAPGSWAHPVPPDERRRRPVVLEALYRAADRSPEEAMYYFEAVRRYEGTALARGEAGRPPCDLLTYAWGWLRRRARGAAEVSVSAVVSDCYRWNVPFVLPLGLLRLDARAPLWVVQVSSWAGEAYLVVEPRPPQRARTRIETRGGVCR